MGIVRSNSPETLDSNDGVFLTTGSTTKTKKSPDLSSTSATKTVTLRTLNKLIQAERQKEKRQNGPPLHSVTDMNDRTHLPPSGRARLHVTGFGLDGDEESPQARRKSLLLSLGTQSVDISALQWEQGKGTRDFSDILL